MTEKEDINDSDDMEQKLDELRRDRVEDLANTAQLLGSWMSDQDYTIAEQLTITELLRSSVLVVYIQMNQMEGMKRFLEEHPNARIVVTDSEKPPAPSSHRTFDPKSRTLDPESS